MTLNDRAVSEEVASILLIAVVVTVIGLFSVNLFSGFQTTLPPAVDLRYSNTSSGVYLHHAGGDTVDRDRLQVYVGGVEVTGAMADISSGSPNTDWTTLSNGMTLWYPTSGAPTGVMVIYSGPEVEEVLYTAGQPVGPVGTPTGAGPIADFTASPTSGIAPLTVSFQDLSTGSPVSWSWTFGDGDTSTAQNPVHTYSSGGMYTVYLTVTDGTQSDMKVKINYIEVVSGPPETSFYANVTNGTRPLAVQFTDTSTGSPTGWSWTFGDGNTSAEQNPVHTYEMSGTFDVSLTASNTYGGDTSTRSGYITVSDPKPPIVNFTANITLGTRPLAVQFTDTSSRSPTSWSWTFGDGGTSTLQNPIHTYAASGLYDVSLTATNADGTNSTTKSAFINVTEPIPPTADFTANATAGTLPLVVQFNDTSLSSPTSWSWTFGDGGTSSIQNPVHTYSVAGLYSVSLTATNEHGSDTETKTEYINVTEPIPPTADFTADPTSGVSPLTVQFTDTSTGTPTSWSWSFGDGDTSTAQNLSHTYADAGNYTVSLTATNAYGSDTLTRVDFIAVLEPMAADFSADQTEGAYPLTVQFTDTSIGSPSSWSWTFGDGGTSAAPNPEHTYATAGTYTVTLTATNAFNSDTETKTDYITVTEPVAADFTADPTTGEAPLTVQFTDTSTGTPTSWAWDFGDGGTSTAQNPSHTYGSAGTYTVTLTAEDAYSADTETKTDYITLVIYESEEDLEEELDNWDTTGTVEVDDTTFDEPVIYLTSQGEMTQTIGTVGYTNVVISFDIAADRIEPSDEGVYAEWFDGTSWYTLVHLVDGNDDGQLHSYSFSLPASADDNPDFAVRFRIESQGSGNNDDAFVDITNLEITGDPIP